jgi:TPR repeat protein
VPEGKLRLGLIYLKGIGVEQNLEEARRWLGEAADAGSTYGMLQMAQTWRKPWTDPPDPAKAQEWFERAQAAGDVDALAYAGFMHEEGETPDLAAARRNFESAAAAGSALARARLGQIYLEGEGVGVDAKKAFEYFRAAADQGNAAAFLGLGFLYESGQGVARNPRAAREWYEKASATGLTEARLRLAYMSLDRNTLEGELEASRWLAMAAAQSEPRALNDYAWLLATSQHPEVRDGTRAVILARLAVEKTRRPGYLDTLAAAYAEAGRFTEAVAAQQAAIAEAPADDRELHEELNLHLRTFEAGKPWRE